MGPHDGCVEAGMMVDIMRDYGPRIAAVVCIDQAGEMWRRPISKRRADGWPLPFALEVKAERDFSGAYFLCVDTRDGEVLSFPYRLSGDIGDTIRFEYKGVTFS